MFPNMHIKEEKQNRVGPREFTSVGLWLRSLQINFLGWAKEVTKGKENKSTQGKGLQM